MYIHRRKLKSESAMVEFRDAIRFLRRSTAAETKTLTPVDKPKENHWIEIVRNSWTLGRPRYVLSLRHYRTNSSDCLWCFQETPQRACEAQV